MKPCSSKPLKAELPWPSGTAENPLNVDASGHPKVAPAPVRRNAGELCCCCGEGRRGRHPRQSCLVAFAMRAFNLLLVVVSVSVLSSCPCLDFHVWFQWESLSGFRVGFGNQGVAVQMKLDHDRMMLQWAFSVRSVADSAATRCRVCRKGCMYSLKPRSLWMRGHDLCNEVLESAANSGVCDTRAQRRFWGSDR